MKEVKEEEVVEESWRRWRCDGRGKICLVDMAHSGKYSQMDKAWKGGREGVGKHDRRKNLKLSVWIFFYRDESGGGVALAGLFVKGNWGMTCPGGRWLKHDHFRI